MKKINLPIEKYPTKKTKFWVGFVCGVVIGYIPFWVHMNI
jgi:heme/copper-type cytochrome/quinol oxidase subunit 4